MRPPVDIATRPAGPYAAPPVPGSDALPAPLPFDPDAPLLVSGSAGNEIILPGPVNTSAQKTTQPEHRP